MLNYHLAYDTYFRSGFVLTETAQPQFIDHSFAIHGEVDSDPESSSNRDSRPGLETSGSSGINLKRRSR